MSSRASGKLETTQVVTVTKGELRRLLIFGAEGAHVHCDEAGLVFFKTCCRRGTHQRYELRAFSTQHGILWRPHVCRSLTTAWNNWFPTLNLFALPGGKFGRPRGL